MNKSYSVTIARFLVSEEVLTPESGANYQLHATRARNFDVEAIISQCERLLVGYLEKFHHGSVVDVKIQYLVNTEDPKRYPLYAVVSAKTTNNCGLSKSIANELTDVAENFINSTTEAGKNILDNEDTKVLAPDQKNYTEEHIVNFINNKKGDKIRTPFICEIARPDGTTKQIPVQGCYKKPVSKNITKNVKKTFLAYADGTHGSKMLIFLRPIANDGKPSKSSETFIAETAALTKSTAMAYTADQPLVKVTSNTKIDERGKKLNYVSEIVIATAEDISTYIADDQLQINYLNS